MSLKDMTVLDVVKSVPKGETLIIEDETTKFYVKNVEEIFTVKTNNGYKIITSIGMIGGTFNGRYKK